MGVNLSGRSFLKLLDLTTEEIEYLLKLSKNFKDMKRAGVPHRYLEGKNIVLLFQKTSTRTRCAFEVGGMDLGMGVTYLDPGSSQMGKKESIEDTARVLGRMFDGIEYRGFEQSKVETLAAFSGVPRMKDPVTTTSSTVLACWAKAWPPRARATAMTEPPQRYLLFNIIFRPLDGRRFRSDAMVARG